MTAETPRTDAIHGQARQDPWIEQAYSEVLDLARTLERDLQECVELLEFLNSHFMGKLGSSVVPLAEMQALLARLKGTPAIKEKKIGN